MKGVGIITGTKNDVELIEFFIHHHLRLGFKKIHIMDFNSTDGTKDILQKYIGHPNLDIILSEANHGIPQLHRWLRLRAYLEPSTDHVIYLDADEMMVLKPKTKINDIIVNDARVVNEFPRYNIVNPNALKQGLSERLLNNLHKMYFHTPLLTMNLPIQPENEWIEWIKRPIPSKVLHQKVTVNISLGGHYAIASNLHTLYNSGRAFIAHFPVTTYKRMIDKIISLKSMIETSPHLKGVFFRYIRICYVYDQGLAEEMFKHLYLGKEEVKILVKIDQIKSGKSLLNQAGRTTDISCLDHNNYTGRNYLINMELAHKSKSITPAEIYANVVQKKQNQSSDIFS